MKTLRLRVPSPAEPGRLDRFVAANLHGISRKRVKGLIDAGSIKVAGRPARRAGRPVHPGEVVEVQWRPSWATVPELAADALVAEGDGWCAIRKPPGLPSHRTADEALGAPERFAARFGKAWTPAHRLDRETSGLLVLAEGSALRAWSEAFAARTVHKTYVAIVHPAPGGDAKLTDEGADMHADMEVRRRSRDGSRAEVVVRPREGRTHQVRRLLAAAGHPIVGDLEYGVPLPGGAPRMALHCARMEREDVLLEAAPGEGWEALLNPPPVVAPRSAPPSPPPSVRRAPRADRRTLRVSKATARILRGGHPWVVRDRHTGDTRSLQPGTLVELVAPDGERVATAVVDPSAKVCARVVSLRPGVDLSSRGWSARAQRALDRRRGLTSAQTDAVRLVHGQADGLPGLFVDRWGPLLIATRTSAATAAFRDAVYEVVRAHHDLPLYEKDHLTDLRARRDGHSGDALAGRWVHGSHAGDQAWVREAGLRFSTTPFEGLTTGFYPDQRANRILLRSQEDLPGARIANLFGHTGAFSVALAAAGAASVTTVDLSGRYLAIAEANLRANDLDPDRHPVVATDAVRWIESQEGLDGVVLDPPAFAQTRGRGRGFSAKGDYSRLVSAVTRSLRPGGWMLCCRNLRAQRRGSLRADVEAGVTQAGRRVLSIRRAGPAPDYPVLKGFPEGTSFAGVFVRVGAGGARR